KTLRLATAMFWVAGFQMITTNFFQSVGEAGKSIFMSLTRQVLFIIPFLLILPHFWHIDGVWLAFPFADACSITAAILLMAWEVKKIKKIQQRG
ncbi:MAG: MATE family efflux transporter, partial [Sodaliphilus sp.]|nr:MATE family efflux transporter [Sodaliphilus sp.]